MNLLVISNNPERASYRQRIGIYIKTLRQNGINFEVAKLPASESRRLKTFKLAMNFDAVFLHKKALNFLDIKCLQKYSKKIIYDIDDAVMYSSDKPQSNITSHYRKFRRTAKTADMVIAGNQYLAEHARRYNQNVHIMPTGLDTKRYDVGTKTKSDDKIRLVWIGSKSTLSYLEKIKPALEEIGKAYDNVILRIICNKFFDLKFMKVEKCQWSLESQYYDLATSDIGLAPLPNNRFTRGKCGFKILQYQAAALPVVTSPVGINAEFVQDGQTGFYSQDIGQWVEKLRTLLEESNLRQKMGDAGKINVKKFDKKIIGEKLQKLIIDCLEECSNKNTFITNYTATESTTKKSEKKISICIPTYNRKEYLRETIESILAQSYKNYEIVIVDDGSTDGTKEMIKSLNVPVTYYRQENSGDAATRNKLIELAKGNYISFIDSDDLLLPDAIERMVNAVESEKKDVIVYGTYFRIDEKGFLFSKSKRKLYSGYITNELFQTIIVHSCGSMFPKKIFNGPVTFDTSLRICSDYDLWLQLSMQYKFAALDYPTFKRRRHPQNLSKPCYENCLIELSVLKNFYYEKGGNKIIPEKTAKRVFSKESRRVGLYALAEGLYGEATAMLKQSFRYQPNIKSLLRWIKAAIIKHLKK